MKAFWIAFILVFLALLIGKFTHYAERMSEYNAHVCAVNGYQADCKTPLK